MKHAERTLSIVDSNAIILQVDLCSADGLEGRNVIRHPVGPGNVPAVVSLDENVRSGHLDPSALPSTPTAVSEQPYRDRKRLQIKEKYGRLKLFLNYS